MVLARGALLWHRPLLQPAASQLQPLLQHTAGYKLLPQLQYSPLVSQLTQLTAKLLSSCPAAQKLNGTMAKATPATIQAEVVAEATVADAVQEVTSGLQALGLASKEDMYGGVIVDHEKLPNDPAAFADALRSSLQEWQQAGRRGIWLKIPIQQSALIPVAVEQGQFKFHHAEQDYVMLTRWLPNTENTLPPNASHQMGIGALVVNERREVLVVQERNGPLKGKGVWKMPTGLVHSGEDLTEAAEREVLEETGIRTKFDAVLAVRQAHGFAFGKSDIFFLCALKAEPGQDQVSPQESELDAACWLPFDEFRSQEFFKGMALYDKMMDRCAAYADGRYRGLTAAKLDFGAFRKRVDLFIFGEDDHCSKL